MCLLLYSVSGLMRSTFFVENQRHTVALNILQRFYSVRLSEIFLKRIKGKRRGKVWTGPMKLKFVPEGQRKSTEGRLVLYLEWIK